MGLRHQIAARAIIPLVLSIPAITAFITWQSAQLATSSIDTFEQNVLKSKQGDILNLTKLAVSTINDIYRNAAADGEAAKHKVKAILAALNDGQDGYFFVYDYDGNTIVHPREFFRAGLSLY